MALFDACKTFEKEKKSLNSKDESNDDLVYADLLPIDPQMLHVKHLKPKEDNMPVYTLVLDLDETLIHYHDNGVDTQTEDEADSGKLNLSPEKKSRLEDSVLTGKSESIDYGDGEDDGVEFSIRPGLSSFLSQLSHLYELVLYTAATREYADYFLRLIDPKNFFGDRVLTRKHVKFTGDFAIKDLRLLGRDLSKTIIIDNLKENFERTTPDNGIHISNFEGCFDDTELPKYQRFLSCLAHNEETDVKSVIRNFRDKWETYE